MTFLDIVIARTGSENKKTAFDLERFAIGVKLP